MHKSLIITLLVLVSSLQVQAEVIVIGHSDMSELSTKTITRIFTGKTIEIDGNSITPINYHEGNPVRDKFLIKFLNKNEDKYSAYWTVRRFIGKGTPPKELASTTEIIDYVGQNPGAVAYIDNNDMPISVDIKILSQ